VSEDGKTFGPPVYTGTFKDISTPQTVRFAAKKAKMVQLKVLSEAGHRGPWASASEVLVLGTDAAADPAKPLPGGGGGVPTGGGLLDRKGWSADADSYKVGIAPPTSAIDGSPTTYWHTDYFDNTGPKLPHYIDITMAGGVNKVDGLRYLPRQGGVQGQNGRIGKFEARTLLSPAPCALPAMRCSACLLAGFVTKVCWPAPVCAHFCCAGKVRVALMLTSVHSAHRCS
jgi:galactose oxidase